MGFSVGLGLTNECNLSCAHCYRPGPQVQRLSLKDVKRVCSSIPVASANLGTGENGLHPEFLPIVDYLHDRGIKTSLTSNGFSVGVLDDARLKKFHDLEISFDFPDERGQDGFRGQGAWRMAVDALERCGRLGVEVTMLAVMMRINYNVMGKLARLAHSFGVNLRINVYQPVRTDQFTLTYHQFWGGFRELFAAAPVVASTEPVVSAVMGLNPRTGVNHVQGPSCGRVSLRITPSGVVLPCVYWPRGGITMAELESAGPAVVEGKNFQECQAAPAVCASCPVFSQCRGGCASRRALKGNLDSPDQYCPIILGDDPGLDHELTDERELLHAANVCTTIVRGVR